MIVGIGQDSHRFLKAASEKKFVIGGITFEGVPGLDANSDGDVILHAICNAISSISGIPILGGIANKLCKDGITDSCAYVAEALKGLKSTIAHVALSVEAKQPRMQERCDEIRQSVANVLDIELSQVGLTFTSGDELTDFGKGLGLQCFCILTTQ